jgi:pimeloyl-ACP methyl ester carboxylesterase
MRGAPSRDRFVELNRTRLKLWEWGDEHGPAVICCHGAYDHGRMWDGLAGPLADLGYRVVAPDLRGHGDSGRLSSGHTWLASALDLCLLARELGGSVGMIGHSFGGGQAMYAAGVWPELARWVVNLDGLGPPGEGFTEGDIAESASRGLASAERVLLSSPRVYATLDEMVERRARVNGRLPREWVEHLVRFGAAEVEGGFVWKADPMFSVGLPGDFSLEHLHAEHSMIKCPVLVLTGGEHDTWSEMSPDETVARLAHIPDVRHEVIEGAGHYVHVEQPGLVMDAICRFLDQVDS